MTGNAGLGPSPLTLLGVHVHLALSGFVLLVVVGVATHLLPMFLLSHGAPTWPAKVAAAALGAGCLSLRPSARRPRLVADRGAARPRRGALIAMGALFYRHRVKKRLDPGMRLARAGMIGLVVTVGLGFAALAGGGLEPRSLTAYGVAALGALSLFVAGHHYKIVPFLIWFHRFGARLGTGPVPRVADLCDARIARIAGALLVAGVAGVLVGVLAGSPSSSAPRGACSSPARASRCPS